ncbi:MAG: hypothetical protein A2X05_11415 [Bacteroidetes bacterium GWE2_41_25]|nr:MAG: hypothetical protein A2X05_11415 [Bacteroidetes bacterium GWE2_41_25]HCU18715.1 hypothetical protein [Bacteroidales bacterium]
MRFQKIIILSCILFSTQFLSAQYYDTGQDPSSIKWLQIKTGRFRVIYPETYGNEGILFAKSLDEAYTKMKAIFPEKKIRIPVIIHSYSTKSNGYVAWAPRRMELYPAPEQNSIPLETKRQLAIHELTHVLQLVSLNQGFSGLMSVFLGEQFTGISAVFLPLWYFEGNAVFAESALTESGRGRTPSFQQQFKAITIENDKKYKYDKIVNDSYKTYIPDHYQSGYQMVTYALAKNGMQVWNKTLDYTARKPYLLNPVNISLSKNAGLTKKKLYNETFDTLRTIWNKELSEKQIITYKPGNPPKQGEFRNYYNPVYAGKDSIIAIKTSMEDPSSFVLINALDRTEKRIHTPGQMYPYTLSYARGLIVWVENKPDPRWENRNFSVIKILDLKTGKTRQLSNKSRYMAAALSPDGSVIAAVENTIKNLNSLVLIDPGSGEVIRSAGSPQNGSLQRPQWEPEGKKLTVISLTEEGEGILSYSIEDNKWEILIEYGRDDLQASLLRNDSLFFISSASGTDNVYLKSPGNKTLCLTRSKYGIKDIFLKDNTMLFNNYSVSGYDVCLAGIYDVSDVSYHDTASSSFLINRFDMVSDDAGTKDLSDYKPEPYRKYTHLFRFHSWMPFYADIEEVKDDPASVRPGLTLLSQNQLSTLTTAIGYEYTEDKEHLLHSRLTWKAWYPVFESRIDYGGDPGIYTGGESVSNPENIKRGIRSFNSVNLPLRFNSGRFSQYIKPSVTCDYRNKYIYVIEEGTYDYGQAYLSGRLFISNYYRSSVRDIYPKWAQTIDLNYYFSPFNSDIYAPAASIKTSFYIPGLLPNNGIKVRFEKEKQGESAHTMNNRISFPRGYKNIISKDLDFLSVDYVFPLAYPDFNIASLFYLKRIRCSLFGDYASGTDNYYLKETNTGLTFDYRHNYNEIFRSFGLELLADFHLLRLPFMISGGVQTAWTDIDKNPVFGILFNIQLFGMAINREKL